MRAMVWWIGLWSLLWAGVFLADFLVGSRRFHNGPTGGDVVWSASGSILVIGAVLADTVLDTGWSRWLPGLAVVAFAGLGYPAWWLRMRHLTRRKPRTPDRIERGGHPGEHDLYTSDLPRLPDGPGPGSG